MTDHATTIRRLLSHFSANGLVGDESEQELHDAAEVALDALLAELQQAIDALRELNELDIPFAKVREIIRAALVKLGEQP